MDGGEAGGAACAQPCPRGLTQAAPSRRTVSLPDRGQRERFQEQHLKKVMHRGWAYFQARLAFTMAAFNVLVQWHGFQPTASGFAPLSMAEFSL